MGHHELKILLIRSRTSTIPDTSYVITGNERSKGTGVTILVQSSSITLSTLTPLCGIGVVEIDRAYSMNVGADIGTTFTSLIAALASTGTGFINSLQVSLGKSYVQLRP